MSQIMRVNTEPNAWRINVIHECKMFLYSTIKLIVHHVTHSTIAAGL